MRTALWPLASTGQRQEVGQRGSGQERSLVDVELGGRVGRRPDRL
ncbi:MAG: hypothetical protein V9H69_19400 [Anaerolineae bacterium]